MEVRLAHDKGAFEMSVSETEVQRSHQSWLIRNVTVLHLQKKPAAFREAALSSDYKITNLECVVQAHIFLSLITCIAPFMGSLYDCVLTMSAFFTAAQPSSFDLAKLTLAYNRTHFFFLYGVTALCYPKRKKTVKQ